jgi:hypothetical protein
LVADGGFHSINSNYVGLGPPVLIDRTVVNYIAKYPETGVTLTDRYAGNSESIARTHYLAWLSQETGEKWFAIRRADKAK